MTRRAYDPGLGPALSVSEIEAAVLVAVGTLTAEQGAYGRAIADRLYTRAGRPMLSAQVYLLLRRLTAGGYLRRWVQVTPRGHLAQYYALTARGDEAVGPDTFTLRALDRQLGKDRQRRAARAGRDGGRGRETEREEGDE